MNMDETLKQLEAVATGLEALKGQLNDIIASLTPPTSDETTNEGGEADTAAPADTTTGSEVASVETADTEGIAPVE